MPYAQIGCLVAEGPTAAFSAEVEKLLPNDHEAPVAESDELVEATWLQGAARHELDAQETGQASAPHAIIK